MTEPGPLIRNATSSDAEAIAHVHIRTWQDAYANIFPQEHLAELSDTLAARTDQWRTHITVHEAIPVLVVAEVADGRVVGFAGAGAQTDPEHIYEAELFVLYILPEFQRKGLGQALFSEVVSALQNLGFSSMLLWVLAQNRSARQFYEKMGGILIGEKEFNRWGEQYMLAGYGWPELFRLDIA